jgi:hypothetical protein
MRRLLVMLLGLSLTSGALTSAPSWTSSATASDSTTVETSLLDSILVVIDEQDYTIRMQQVAIDSCLAVSEGPSWKLPGNWLTYSIAAVIGALAGILAVK